MIIVYERVEENRGQHGQRTAYGVRSVALHGTLMGPAAAQKGVFGVRRLSLVADSEESCAPCLPHAVGRRPPFPSQSLIPGLLPVMGLIETKSSQSTAKDRKGPFWLLSSLWRQQVQVLCAHCAFSWFALSWLLGSTQCSSFPRQGLSYCLTSCPVNSRLAAPHAAGWVFCLCFPSPCRMLGLQMCPAGFYLFIWAVGIRLRL